MQGVDFCKGRIPGAEGALPAQERGPACDAKHLLCVGLQGHHARVKMNDRCFVGKTSFPVSEALRARLLFDPLDQRSDPHQAFGRRPSRHEGDARPRRLGLAAISHTSPVRADLWRSRARWRGFEGRTAF